MSTKHMDYWNHVLWSYEMKINLFGSGGFKLSVSYLQSSMIVGMSWSGAA